MTIRIDHVAGAFFVVFGLVVLALSGDLPVGQLSMPGAGMMPKLVTILMIGFGLVLVIRAGESEPLVTIDWADLKHAGPVMVITVLTIRYYEQLGFIVAMTLMLFALIVGIERRRIVPAAVFSVGVTMVTYILFVVALKTPLEQGIFGFWQ